MLVYLLWAYMVQFGYYASLEEYSPSSCVEQVVLAEETGFDSIWTTDHFNPWIDRLHDDSPAENGDCWSWMAAALDRTDSVTVGPGVTAMLNRHHPATVAQSLATLMDLYPDRIFLGVGTGEPVNEGPIGYPWPDFNERAQRTAEAIRIIRMMFENEKVSYEGKFWKLHDAYLLTGPDTAPPIYVAASGRTTARMAGDLGDGFLTVRQTTETIENELLPALEKGVEKSDRNSSMGDLPKFCFIHSAFNVNRQEALESSLHWRALLLPMFFKYNIYDPAYIREHGDRVSTEQLEEEFLISSDPQDFIETIEMYREAGFDNFVFHSSSPDQTAFCEMFMDDVMPSFN